MIGSAGASGAILKHLVNYGSLTQAEAADKFGCYRLAARIKEFRNAGYRIDTVKEECITRYGRKCTYARYVMPNEQRKALSKK